MQSSQANMADSGTAAFSIVFASSLFYRHKGRSKSELPNYRLQSATKLYFCARLGIRRLDMLSAVHFEHFDPCTDRFPIRVLLFSH